MGLFDSLTSWFRREAADVKQSIDRLEADLDADLSRKERELTATPEERMEMIQDDTSVDDAFAAIQDKIDGRQAHADATAELAPEPDEPTES